MTIDVMMPFWGERKLLEVAVQSVLAQSNPSWRLVVIDDAYPDPTVPAYFDAIVDPRVTYRRNDVNVGLIENFRRAVASAEADLVVIMGCDDVLEPGYVDAVIRAASDHPEADIIQPGVRVIDETGREWLPLADRIKQRMREPWVRRRQPVGGQELTTSLLHGNWLYWPSLAFRTSAIQAVDFRDEYRIILDLALILELLRAGSRVAVTGDPVFRYRRHAASVSSSEFVSGARFSDERRFFAETSEVLKSHGWPRAARAARMHLTSRLYAASLLPAGIRSRNLAYVARLLRHIVA